MPSRLDTTVLSLDINNIKKMDTNTENLFGMWTIFSKCADSLENGRRLENLSWRLWNRETFCVAVDDTAATDESVSVTLTSSQSSLAEEIPDLSASVDSATSDCDRLERRHNSFDSVDNYARPAFGRRDSTERSRGKETHITPDQLAELMIDLGKDKIEVAEQELASHRRSIPQPIVSAPQSTVNTDTSSATSASSAESDTSEMSSTSNISSHSVVRGFTPGVVSSSYRSSLKLSSHVPESIDDIEAPGVATAAPVTTIKSKNWIIGSSSASDGSASLDSRFGSALSSNLKKKGSASSDKHPTFMSEVSTRTLYDEDDISDDENVSESAIEDDDDLDWDSVTESGHSSYRDDNLFARVDSPRPVLASRRSLLSSLLHQPERAAALAKAGSRSTPIMRSRVASPNGPSLAPSPSQDSPVAFAQSNALPITTPSNIYAPVPSPRTTRRHMLQTELTESLRKGLLWERQQKNPTSTAIIKRRHTTHDLSKLSDFPQNADDASMHNSYNRYFDQGLQEYHVAGW